MSTEAQQELTRYQELREVLENLMLWQVKNVRVWNNGAYDQASMVIKRHDTALQKALAEQPSQQEPVACGGEQEAPYIGHDCNPALPDTMKVFCPACCTKFRAIPAGVQKLMLDAGFEPPFTSPPAQEFVCSTGLCHYRKPLTDEEIRAIVRKVDEEEGHIIHFARAIEAAHGITGEQK